jgi:RNA ligase-like protein
MKKYNKINTLFERDEQTKQITDKLTRPIYGTLKWLVTEKVNGTNVRIGFTRDDDKEIDWEIGGRTDDAAIPATLVKYSMDLAKKIKPVVRGIMGMYGLTEYVLHGEGYGAKVHHGGRYSEDNKFILFDVSVGGDVYLTEDVVTQTAARLDIPRVPFIGDSELYTVDEIVDIVRQGYASDVADEFDPTFMAEGIVAKTIEPLYDNRGERVMFKLKARDFRATRKKLEQ